MRLSEKLTMLRKRYGYSQEKLANTLGVARQTISTWENGQAIPELNAFIRLSNVYGITIDQIVKDEEACLIRSSENIELDTNQLILFLIKAKHNTYLSNQNNVRASRIHSNDYSYCDQGYRYYDTYVGNAQFSGEEVVWLYDIPVWSLNYTGRICKTDFDVTFLKEALLHSSIMFPYRGPANYTKGDNQYSCRVDGTFEWFQGYEEIIYKNERLYECYFHGGRVK